MRLDEFRYLNSSKFGGIEHVQVASIPFQELEFISLLDSQTQEIFVSPRSICEIFEINWHGQYSKLIENVPRWKYQTILIKLPGDDRKRKLGVLPEKKVRSWICSINPEKVKSAIKEQLIAFQDECDEVLHNYWSKGIAVNPRANEHFEKLSLQMNSLAQEFIKMNERISILESKVDSMMEVRGSFNERHWLFGKFVEIIANEIDFNCNEIKKTQQMLQNKPLEKQQDKNVVSKMKDLFDKEKSIPSWEPILPTLTAENQPNIFSPKIDKKQAEKFRELVKEKGRNRKGVSEIWSQFKQKFQLKTYYDLPSSKFQQALRWLNQL